MGGLPSRLKRESVGDGHTGNVTVAVAPVPPGESPNCPPIRQRGKEESDALACGFAAMGDAIIVTDADWPMGPSEIPRLIEALAERTDFAKRSPTPSGGGSADLSPCRQFGNRWPACRDAVSTTRWAPTSAVGTTHSAVLVSSISAWTVPASKSERDQCLSGHARTRRA